MKYYLIAGEASGDLHGASLIKNITKQDPDAVIMARGGDKMEEAGATLLMHYHDVAFMGFVEVVRNLPLILRNIKKAKKEIAAFEPDAIILIDYPGFNLRIVKWAHKKGYRIFYYIAPQLWAWQESRIKYFQRYIDHLYVILPFEKRWFSERGVDVSYFGHPLVDLVDQHSSSVNPKSLVLLPGSRKQEISRMLPIMIKAAKHLPYKKISVAALNNHDASLYTNIIEECNLKQSPELVYNKTHELLSSAAFVLVTSGTASLETALFGVPGIICYKSNYINYILAKQLVNVEYIGLANLILKEEMMPELIQSEMTTGNIIQRHGQLLQKKRQYELQVKKLREKLFPPGAAQAVAQDIVSRTS